MYLCGKNTWFSELRGHGNVSFGLGENFFFLKESFALSRHHSDLLKEMMELMELQSCTKDIKRVSAT